MKYKSGVNDFLERLEKSGKKNNKEGMEGWDKYKYDNKDNPKPIFSSKELKVRVIPRYFSDVQRRRIAMFKINYLYYSRNKAISDIVDFINCSEDDNGVFLIDGLFIAKNNTTINEYMVSKIGFLFCLKERHNKKNKEWQLKVSMMNKIANKIKIPVTKLSEVDTDIKQLFKKMPHVINKVNRQKNELVKIVKTENDYYPTFLKMTDDLSYYMDYNEWSKEISGVPMNFKKYKR